MLVNSTQFIHVCGSSYIITTNYEKGGPHVWDARLVHQSDPLSWLYMSSLLIADRSTKI